ncbi:EamA family transporter [Virgibacillus dokdonensis]|uniref:EamA family transporter n=1 Tax=Virgibacillus dokdonensis TaxID=302167 RepID=A0ABU7VH19_9BACI|nr:EamA family transporter [Virgibacillus dokdonensis]
MGITFAILSACTFAINNVVVKKGIMRDTHNDNGLFITVIINIILLGLLCFIVIGIRGWNFEFSWTAIFFFSLAGLCTTGIGRFTLFSSISYIGPSKASAIRNSTPIFTTLFALIIIKENIAFLPGVGMVLLLGGIINEGIRISTSKTSKQEHIPNSFTVHSKKHQYLGVGLALLSALTFGVGQGFRKQGLIETNDAFLGAWIGALASFIFLILYKTVRKEFTAAKLKKSFTTMNPFYLTAGVLTSLGPLFFFLAAQTMEVSYVSVIAATEPLITILISAAIFKGIESITIGTWLTIFIMLFGTILIAINM